MIVIIPTWALRCSKARAWLRQHRLCPAGGSSCQYQGSGGQGPPPAPSQPVRQKPQTVPALRGLPGARPVPQCSFTATQHIHECRCLSLTPQTPFLCHPWGINKSMTQFLPWCCRVAQSCPTLCEPMDCSPPGSSAHGILQARRILEWVAMPTSRGPFQPRGQTRVSFLLHC